MSLVNLDLPAERVQLALDADGVAVLTLNEPAQRNAMSDAMIEALAVARAAIDARDDVRVLVLTGAGACFSAGGSVQNMLERRGMFSGNTAFEAGDCTRQIMQRIPQLLYDIAIPTIAAVNGPAVGGGCDAALMCDIRLASPKAAFSEAFLRVGLIPGDGGAWFLPRVVGVSRAMEMALTCERVDADEALRIGLVSKVVPADALLAEALALARRIAAQPPYAARLTKRLIRYGAQAGLADTLEMSANMQAQALMSAEHREAVRVLHEALQTRARP